MRTNLAIFAMVSVLSTVGVSPTWACPSHAESTSAVNRVDIPQLDALLRDGKVDVFDANTASTRTKYGVIPGAVLLSSAVEYALDQLPRDKHRPLVFYCANPHCTASETAAERAVAGGYTQVAVLPDGIMGWRQAGRPTTTAVPRS